MKSISKEQLKEALDQVNIEWFLDSQGVEMKHSFGHSGMQLNLKECPFCGDTKWRTYVNADTGLGNCFAGSCTQGGFNKFQLLRAFNRGSTLPLIDSIKDLLAKQGLVEFKRVVFEPDFSEMKLPNGCLNIDELGEVHEYLAKRGINEDTCRKFDLQWCDYGKFQVTTATGLVTQDYSKRIVIPIYDLDGKLVTFQGRDTTGESERRYLFPPAFAGTGAYIYNGNNYSNQESVVLSEGVFDVLAVDAYMVRHQLHNSYHACGIFGLSLSSNRPDGNDQLTRLVSLKAKGLKNIYLMLDGETVAAKAAMTIAKLCKEQGFRCFICYLPKGKDPSECSDEEITESLKNAKEIKSLLDEVTMNAKAKSYYGNK